MQKSLQKIVLKKAFGILEEWAFNFFRTVSNKNTHLAVFKTSVFRVYLRNHLSYKKVNEGTHHSVISETFLAQNKTA